MGRSVQADDRNREWQTKNQQGKNPSVQNHMMPKGTRWEVAREFGLDPRGKGGAFENFIWEIRLLYADFYVFKTKHVRDIKKFKWYRKIGK